MTVENESNHQKSLILFSLMVDPRKIYRVGHSNQSRLWRTACRSWRALIRWFGTREKARNSKFIVAKNSTSFSEFE